MSQQTATMRVSISDARLRDALVSRLRKTNGISIASDADSLPADSDPNEVVVATVADCPVSAVPALARAGVRLVILAAVPNHLQADRYREAGAVAYLPMDIDLRPLVDAIHSAAMIPSLR